MHGWLLLLLVTPKSKLGAASRSSMANISEGGERGGPTGIAVVGMKSFPSANWYSPLSLVYQYRVL